MDQNAHPNELNRLSSNLPEGSNTELQTTAEPSPKTPQTRERKACEDEPPKLRGSLGRKCVGCCKWIIASPFLFLSLYLSLVLVGLIPVNNDFQQAKKGITIHIFSTEVHSDIVMPIDTDIINWRDEFPAECFDEPPSDASHVAIGWGARKFFIETAGWKDFKVSTAAKALMFPSATCMHVRITTVEGMVGKLTRSITITPEQYQKLVDFITSEFKTDDAGNNIWIEGAAYDWEDAFFEAKGTYTCINTCNAWAGRALTSAGIRAPWFAPMPRTLCMYVPEGK
ncbi:MAG: TIGR02117 family protein [Gemmataceae bacterium]